MGEIAGRMVGARRVSAGSGAEPAGRPVPVGPPGPPGPAEPARSSRTELGRAARARSGRADDHAAIRIDADRLGLHAGRVLHREVDDSPLVREHRLERHGLPARLDARCDAASDLAQLLLAAPAIPLDVERDVDGAPDSPRRDRRRDLLQRDEVLAAATDERAEIWTRTFDALVTGAIVGSDV